MQKYGIEVLIKHWDNKLHNARVSDGLQSDYERTKMLNYRNEAIKSYNRGERVVVRIYGGGEVFKGYKNESYEKITYVYSDGYEYTSQCPCSNPSMAKYIDI